MSDALSGITVKAGTSLAARGGVNKFSRGGRYRSTKVEIANRRDRILDIVSTMQPMSVRAVFYQAIIAGLVDKDDSGYNKVQVDCLGLRRNGDMPYDWITDNTRWQIHATSYDGVKEAIEATARLYRKNLWADSPDYVEFWIEKDALAGTVDPVTYKFDVPLMVARGFSSETFLYSSAEQFKDLGKHVHVYHLGDYDKPGQDAAKKINEGLRRLAPETDITFTQLALTPAQIKRWKLVTRPTKPGHIKTFGNVSCDLDAVDPRQLRALVTAAIEIHLPAHQFAILKEAEASERLLLQSWARKRGR